jgi:hypothetical protein
MTGSNRRHSRCKRDALPTELIALSKSAYRPDIAGDSITRFVRPPRCQYRARTASLTRDTLALFEGGGVIDIGLAEHLLRRCRESAGQEGDADT